MRAQLSANGVLVGSGDTLYVVGYRTGVLSVTDSRGNWRELARGLGSPDGIGAAGVGGSFYMSDNLGGNLYLVPRSADSRVTKLASGLQAPADLAIDQKRGWLVVPENDGNRLSVYRLAPSSR